MIRFRRGEDERRYLLLLGDAYRVLAQKLSPAAMTVVMRNFGKAQDMLMLEGVRQGLAIAAISNLGKTLDNDDYVERLKAFQAHAHVYGSTDTPLCSVEQEWLTKFGADASQHAWLDPRPMRFAPDTEAAAMREHRGKVARERDNHAWDEWDDKEVQQEAEPWDSGEEVDSEAALRDVMKEADLSEEDIVRILGEDGGDRQERPALLDRARSALLQLRDQGYRPGDWSELIMRLHLLLHVDAGFLDLQLSTPMGRTVLSQVYPDIQPNEGLNLGLMQRQIEVEAGTAPGAPLLATPEPGDEGDGGGGGDGDGADPSRIEGG